MKKYISILILFFPWMIRRHLYKLLFKYEIHKNSYIGFSWIFPDKLILSNGAKIGHLTVCKNIASLEMSESSRIGSLNWITGFPHSTKSLHFINDVSRFPALILKEHSAITSRHLIDCTDTITIGEFTTIAGIRSQLLTHSINMESSRQEASPIKIGKYCFIGTNSIVLKGNIVGDFIVISAMSLVNKNLTENHAMYGGVPVKKIKLLSSKYQYFTRKKGFIS
ncbi:MAG: hypothetical protein PHH41_02890 [Sulfurimonas sp.]|nr:hypothetical protein [Sulfurimonas sp.]